MASFPRPAVLIYTYRMLSKQRCWEIMDFSVYLTANTELECRAKYSWTHRTAIVPLQLKAELWQVITNHENDECLQCKCQYLASIGTEPNFHFITFPSRAEITSRFPVVLAIISNPWESSPWVTWSNCVKGLILFGSLFACLPQCLGSLHRHVWEWQW